MCVKFTTLRDKRALEGWICNLEACHGRKSVCMGRGLQGRAELGEQIGERIEDGHGLDELMNNSTSPLKIALNSATRSKTPRVG